jgi:hypothetical protein
MNKRITVEDTAVFLKCFGSPNEATEDETFRFATAGKTARRLATGAVPADGLPSQPAGS